MSVLQGGALAPCRGTGRGEAVACTNCDGFAAGSGATMTDRQETVSVGICTLRQAGGCRAVRRVGKTLRGFQKPGCLVSMQCRFARALDGLQADFRFCRVMI